MCRLDLCNAYGPATSARELDFRGSRGGTVVGAPPLGVTLGEDWPSVQEYARRIDKFAAALDADARAQIVWTDPANLSDLAKEYGEGAPAAVATLAARAKERGPAKTAADVAWGSRWSKWRAAQLAFLWDVTSVSPGVSPSTAWGRLQEEETDLRKLSTDFQALGGTKVSMVLPPTLETPTGKPDDPNAGVPWGTIAIATAVTVSAVAIAKVFG